MSEDSPDEYCEKCGGEGQDADPYGLFDGDFVVPCPYCYKHVKDKTDE